MGEIRNKSRNATQQTKGKFKDSAGRATGDRPLQAKGKADLGPGELESIGAQVQEFKESG